MMKRVIICLASAYANLRQCPLTSNSTGGYEYLKDYRPYNLKISSVDLEFNLDYKHTTVRSNITVTKYSGGDIILNGSDLLELDDISIVYNRLVNNSIYSLKRQLKALVCLDPATNNLVIEAADIPAEANVNGLTISISNHLNPEANTHLFGLYRSRNLLITQNESSGFRRITYYPDRPDVMAVFKTTMKADVKKFPILLSNGNEISRSLENGILTVTYYDPYPKPSYLFALVAGKLVQISKKIKLGDTCWSTLAQLVGPKYREHSLAKYCAHPTKRYEDIVISKFVLDNSTRIDSAELRVLAEESPDSKSATTPAGAAAGVEAALFPPPFGFKDESRSAEFTPVEKMEALAGSLKRRFSGFPDYVSSLFSGASDLIADAWNQARENVAKSARGSDIEFIKARKTSETANLKPIDPAAISHGNVGYGTLNSSSFTPGALAPSSVNSSSSGAYILERGTTGFCPLFELDENWSGILNYDSSSPSSVFKSSTITTISGTLTSEVRSDVCPWYVILRIWAEEGTVELSQLEWALESAHQAMLYDEVRFGRYYDLSEFSIVAALDFNAGAMENKGLNIFNEALILADPSQTTDAQYERIRGVIAHEYFHNWSGDRVTIRDWFQLTLKEGFTVFRDQSFTEDLSESSLMKRLRDIDLMETSQFTQDATPMAHPIRPAKYQTVENFYTVTVYEKGAEVIRMYQTLLGPLLFRKATDLFFKKNIDKPATCEDFLEAIKIVAPVPAMAMAQTQESGSARLLTTPSILRSWTWDQFFKWYSVKGTPRVEVRGIHWSSTTHELKITLYQHIPSNKAHYSADDEDQAGPLVIPLKISLIDPISGVRYASDELIVLYEEEMEFVFSEVHRRPVISLLRGFSAPVKIDSFQSDSDLAFLAVNDDCPYIRFKSFDQLVSNEIRRCMIRTNLYYKSLNPAVNHVSQAPSKTTVMEETCPLESGYVNCEISDTIKVVYDQIISTLINPASAIASANNIASGGIVGGGVASAHGLGGQSSEALLAQLISLPKMSRLKTSIKPFQPGKIHAAIKHFKKQILQRYGPVLLRKYKELDHQEHRGAGGFGGVGSLTGPNSVAYDHSPEVIARRSLKNSILSLLLMDPTAQVVELALNQLRRNAHANDVSAALFGLGGIGGGAHHTARSTTSSFGSLAVETLEVQLRLANWLKDNQNSSILVDRWFTSQMSWPSIECYERFKILLKSELFANSQNPNRLRSLVKSFASNPVAFHQKRSYEIIADEIIRWDNFNPKLAAGLASSFNELSLVEESLKIDGLTAIERILNSQTLSKNTKEILISIKEKIILDS